MGQDPVRDLIADVQRIWDAKAAFWDDAMGDGNDFERELIEPAITRLLSVQPGELILDVGCGGGVNARRLARLGARVVAIDNSEVSLDIARGRETSNPSPVDYRLVDATDFGQLLALGEGPLPQDGGMLSPRDEGSRRGVERWEGERQFEGVVCSMVLMDMPVIEPLLRAAARLLVPRGRLVFAVLHPAFNSIAVNRSIQIVTAPDGQEVSQHAVNVTEYLHVPAGKGTGTLGEPEPHWYFHRPLHALFGACFAAGFVLDGLEEPGFAIAEPQPRSLSWKAIPGIPPVLAARLVLRQGVPP